MKLPTRREACRHHVNSWNNSDLGWRHLCVAERIDPLTWYVIHLRRSPRSTGAALRGHVTQLPERMAEGDESSAQWHTSGLQSSCSRGKDGNPAANLIRCSKPFWLPAV